MKTKVLIIIAISLTMIMLMGFFLFTKYIKLAVNELEKRVQSEIDSVSYLTKVPKPILETDCKFDTATQTDAFLFGKKSFSNYKWDQNKKIADILLSSGERLKVERGGCDRFNFYATIYLENSKLTVKNKKEIIQIAMKTAQELFDVSDFMIFNDALSTGEYQFSAHKNEFLIDINSATHCVAQIYFNNQNGKAEIKIGYTLC